MAIGKRNRERQEELWIPSSEVTRSPGHPFYERVNKLLAEADFDEFVEASISPAGSVVRWSTSP